MDNIIVVGQSKWRGVSLRKGPIIVNENSTKYDEHLRSWKFVLSVHQCISRPPKMPFHSFESVARLAVGQQLVDCHPDSQHHQEALIKQIDICLFDKNTRGKSFTRRLKLSCWYKPIPCPKPSLSGHHEPLPSQGSLGPQLQPWCLQPLG